MGSTHNGSQPQTGTSGQRSLFENADQMPERKKAERGLSADPNVPMQAAPIQLAAENPGSQRPESTTPEAHEPVWVQRLKLVILVVFCVELGMALLILPWTPVWLHNSLISAHPDVRSVFQHYFTRGAVTGLGLIDIWIGIWSAVQYREKK